MQMRRFDAKDVAILRRAHDAIAAGYRALFLRGEAWAATTRGAYLKMFGSPVADVVLRDLADFCGATRDPYSKDGELAVGVAIGRLQVWRRISAFTNLSDREVWDLMVSSHTVDTGELKDE